MTGRADAEKNKKGLRRLGREIALSMLFLHETSGGAAPDEAVELFCQCFGPGRDEEAALEYSPPVFEQALPFARELFAGVLSRLGELDEHLSGASENWRLDRMSRVDRNVMRLGLYEILYRPDIPVKVSINEAVDLGKDFGAEESGAFVNGVLDRFVQQLDQVESEPDLGAETSP